MEDQTLFLIPPMRFSLLWKRQLAFPLSSIILERR